jgi:hypothetical protein
VSPGFDVANDAEYVAQSTTLHDGTRRRRRQALRLRRAVNQRLRRARQRLALLALGPPGPYGCGAGRRAAFPGSKNTLTSIINQYINAAASAIVVRCPVPDIDRTRYRRHKSKRQFDVS